MTDDLFTVTRFDRQGRLISTRTGQPREQLDNVHNGGGTYVHLDDTELKFKPHHLGQPSLRPRPASTRRLSNLQILAAAKRFEADGEMDNAVNMLGLLI